MLQTWSCYRRRSHHYDLISVLQYTCCTFQHPRCALALSSQCIAVRWFMRGVKLLIPGAVVAVSAILLQEVVPEVPVLLGCSITAAPVRLQKNADTLSCGLPMSRTYCSSCFMFLTAFGTFRQQLKHRNSCRLARVTCTIRSYQQETASSA